MKLVKIRQAHKEYLQIIQSCFSWLGNATRVPEHPGKLPVLKPVNPGLCAGKKLGLTGLISIVSTAQKSVQKQAAVKMRPKIWYS